MVDFLTLKSVTVHRRKKPMLGPIDMHLSSTGLTVVIGPNGSGKTTLLRAMHGLERLSGGVIHAQVCPADQAYVFQSPIMLRRSARENLIYPPGLARRGLGPEESHAEVEKWLGIIGLKGEGDRPAPRLSGGEKQKLALARALICNPKLLFLDEPCANLDGRSTREIEQILMDAREAGTRIVLATHDMGQVRRLADDVVFMLNQKVHEMGPLVQFKNGPQTVESKSFMEGGIVE